MNIWSVLFDLCRGFGVTLKLFALTLVIAIPLGLIFAFLSMSRVRIISWLMKLVIWVIRGTPLLLQCVIVTFIPSMMHIANKDVAAHLGISITSLQFYFVLFAFALNYACYFAVIYEGGIKSVQRGQYEAGQVLGMTKTQIFFRVVLLQMIRSIVSPMSNEVITLVKDTALARAMSVLEIISIAYEKVNKYAVITPLFYAGLFYLAFSGLLTLLFHFVEKKLNYYRV